MPAPALIAAGAATTAGAVLCSLAAAPVLLAAAEHAPPQTPPTPAATSEIPAALLPHYRAAPGCAGLPWQVIAGIAAVETNHARHGGARLDPATGDVRPPILGIALDGTRSAAVRVPAGGSPWHPDPTWDHAAGPMQFLTATWTAWATDGSGDRVASPHNAYDAIAAAGRYLCDHRPRLDSIPAAVRRYNPSERYLADVLAKAHAYGLVDGHDLTDGVSPSPAQPAAGGPTIRGDPTPAVRYALAQLGKPYAWGAAGPDAYDCSGLTMRAYQQVGVHLPHKAALQAGYGRPVDWHRRPIRPGDLLFLRGSIPLQDHGHVPPDDC